MNDKPNNNRSKNRSKSQGHSKKEEDALDEMTFQMILKV